MYGTVEYFLDYFREQVSNNLVAEHPKTLKEMYEKQEVGIEQLEMGEIEKQQISSNLDGAFSYLYEELFGS